MESETLTYNMYLGIKSSKLPSQYEVRALDKY